MTDDKPVPDPVKPSRDVGEVRLRQQAIGVGLRRLFDQVVEEDVPEEFLAILRDADSRSTETG